MASAVNAQRNILTVSSIVPGTTALYLIEALRDIGQHVRVVSDRPHPTVNSLASGAFDVPRWIEGEGLRPDVLLFVEGGTRLIVPSGMENLNCVTAWYAIDTHLHLEQHLRIARLFDVTFLAQFEFLPYFRDSQAHWLPFAVDPRLYERAAGNRDIDVAYIGSEHRGLHPERTRLLDLIRSRYGNTFLGRADPSRIGEIYGRAKVVFNKSVRNDVNMRYFEAMGAGAVLVTDSARENGAEELFSAGENFLEYHDDASMFAAIDSVLADDRKRERIGARAQAHVLASHTYRHRAQKIVDVLAATEHRVRPGPEDYLPAYHLLRYPDAVLSEASRSLAGMRTRGDRNLLLALTVPLLSGLAGLLAWAYRLRYRIRHARLARKKAAQARSGRR
ncbi:MAG TPA: glycosyltransferase [Burkholderiales bacterium]|nr:glycosyltransferase [Burkholderiales bacterium]